MFQFYAYYLYMLLVVKAKLIYGYYALNVFIMITSSVTCHCNTLWAEQGP